MEQKAAKLTNDIAREIRRKRRGYNVVPIARARVPIVKFKEYSTGIDVDLSFRSPMPIYNTSLIRLYTRTHEIVRPYLMLLRYWGKLQNVVGGGKPTTLLTNYCYTMMMLFWIMHRNSSIVPSVSDLKYKLFIDNQMLYRPVNPVIVNGWDCSFSENIHEWTSRHHETSIISLAEEFFEFYGKFDASLWVISPLTGYLLSKRDLGNQNRYSLPPILHPYCNVAKFQSNTPFCVQDPFEHNHNIARGLSEFSLAVFQYKCRKAAEICKLIKQKNAPLSLLLKSITVVNAELRHVNKFDKVEIKDVRKNSVPVELVNDNDDENIAVLFEFNNESEQLDEAACCSSNKENQNVRDVVSSVHTTQSVSTCDSVAESLEMNQDEHVIHDHSSDCTDVKKHAEETINNSEPIIESLSDVEVIEDSIKILKSVEVVTIDSALESESDNEFYELIHIDKDNESSNKDCIVTDDRRNEKSPKVPTPLPRAEKSKNKVSVESTTFVESEILTNSILDNLKCNFCFNERQEFSIDNNGNIIVLKGKLMTSHLRENKVQEVIKFVLGNCLMCDIEICLEIDKNEVSLKRKAHAMDDSKGSQNYSSKLFKNESGSASQVQDEYSHLFRIKCSHIQLPWMSRRLVAKKVFRGKNSLLNYEKTLSDRLLKKLQKSGKTNMISYIDIWKKTMKPSHFCATIKGGTTNKPRTNKKHTFKFLLLKKFFELFSRIVEDAFVDISQYLDIIQ